MGIKSASIALILLTAMSVSAASAVPAVPREDHPTGALSAAGEVKSALERLNTFKNEIGTIENTARRFFGSSVDTAIKMKELSTLLKKVEAHTRVTSDSEGGEGEGEGERLGGGAGFVETSRQMSSDMDVFATTKLNYLEEQRTQILNPLDNFLKRSYFRIKDRLVRYDNGGRQENAETLVQAVDTEINRNAELPRKFWSSLKGCNQELIQQLARDTTARRRPQAFSRGQSGRAM